MLRQADSKPVAANGVTASRARRKRVIVLRTRAAAEPDRKAGDAVSKSHIIERVKALDLPSTEAFVLAVARARTTLPGAVASRRVLKKCGFRYVGETVDPEDGTVCRFERAAGDSAGAA